MPTAIEHIFVDGVESKKCCLGNHIAPVSEFWHNKGRHDGLQTYCKVCHLEWKRENKERVNALNRKSKLKNKAKNTLKRLADPVAAREGYKQNYQKHKVKHIAAVTARMKRMPWALHSKISNNVRMSLKNHPKAGRAWQALVGYSLQTLREHLEKSMPQDYTWDDYVRGKLHVDHIIPLAAFNIVDAECVDFKRAWALKNLQLLPAHENLSKQDNLDRPFQPSLAIAV
jgi:hypothetical protein